MLGPLGPSLASQVRASRTIYAWVKPIAKWYINVSGYRKMGLTYDDLLVEENEAVQRALKRLTPREAYDRSYRFKRASQASVLHKPLPKEEWTPEEQDVRYLEPHVRSVLEEVKEREVWDTMAVSRK